MTASPPPPLSVVMPVRNAGAWVDEAVASILGQSWADFEFVILDDGSTDDTHQRLEGWAARDARIRLFRSERRLGPAGSSNFVMERARAPLVARMDGDDVARPHRLERQLALLESRPDAAMVGSVSDVIGPHGEELRGADVARLLGSSPLPPFPHCSILLRRAAFEAVGGYRALADGWEDIDFFLRIAGLGPVLVLAEPLLRSRVSRASSRIRTERDRLEARMALMRRCLHIHAAGGDYDALLAAGPDLAARIDPDSFALASSLALWAGERDGHFLRALRRVALRPDRGTARLLAWAAWADLSPGTLRAWLRASLARRNARARPALGPVAEWRPPGQEAG